MGLGTGLAGRRLITAAGFVTVAATLATEVAYRQSLKHDYEYGLLQAVPAGRVLPVTSADGTRIHAEVFGSEEPAGPTFVLAPGWTEELKLYSWVIQSLLTRDCRIVAYDLRGQGKSGLPQGGDQQLVRYGEDVEAVLAATCAGRDDVILVGHSMGGMSIAAWAADHEVAARVRAVALLSTGFAHLTETSKLVPAALPAALKRQLADHVLGGSNSLPPVSTAVSRAISRYTAFGPDATAAAVAFYEPMLWNCPPRVRARAGQAIGRMDLLHAAANITVPTLVVVGTHDRLTPPVHAERIAAELPNLLELVILPRIGHMTPLECPDRVVRELESLADAALKDDVPASALAG